MTPKLPPIFQRLAGANLAAQSAEQISLAAVPLIAVLALNAGPGEIGALATAQTLPFLLLSIPIGLLADRVSKRRLMVAAEALRTLAFVGLLIAALAGHLSLPLLALLGFLGATGTVGSAWLHRHSCPAWCRVKCWPPPMAGWNWRAASPLRPALRWRVRWWPGPGRRRPLCWRRCCRHLRWCCCSACRIPRSLQTPHWPCGATL